MLPRLIARSAQGASAAALLRSCVLSPRPLSATLPETWRIRGMANSSHPSQSSQAKNHKSSMSQPSSPGSTTQAESTQKPVVPASQAEGEPSQEQVDLSKLPDLTQGIPSTLEYERSATAPTTSIEVADDQEPLWGRGGKAKGELPASAYVSSSERRRQKWANYMYAASALGLVVATIYLGREWNEEEQRKHADVPNGWGIGLWWARSKARLGQTLSYYQEPAFEKLLPDVTEATYRPYTLVISLEDMLVHNEWSREHGWRVAKRPGMDYFIRYLSQYYEIVLWTSIPFGLGEPVLRKLDPFRFIAYPLWREATKYKDGEIVKDLSYLNRDLSKVIILDTEPKHVREQPNNAIILPKWTGDPKDKELVSLVPFLEYIATVNTKDVRKVVQSFDGKHIPTEFARREAIARAEYEKQRHGPTSKPSVAKSTTGGGMGMMSSLLGVKLNKLSPMVMPEGEESPHEAFAKGKMLQDIARERGQRWYENIEKEIRENGGKWLQEEAEMMEKAQKDAMQDMQTSFASWFRSLFLDRAQDQKKLEPKPENKPA